MKITDFKYCKTPVVHCTADGRVTEKNPSAKKNLTDAASCKRLRVFGSRAFYGKYKGFCCEKDGEIWAIFPGFAQFDFEGEVFHFAENAIAVSCERMLALESEISSLAVSKGDTAKLWRVRKMIYDQYAIVFQKEDVPMRLYAIDRFIDSFSRACTVFYPRFGARVRVRAPYEHITELVNVRNATIILTQICTAVLSLVRYQDLVITFSYANGYLCAQINGVTDQIPFVCENERDILRLIEYIPEYAIGLVSLDAAMETCDYLCEYDISDDGHFSIRMYFKAETEIQYLRDKGTEYDFTSDICTLMEMMKKQMLS